MADPRPPAADASALEDPIQRRDLILVDRARTGDLDAFNDLVSLLPGPPLVARRADGPRPATRRPTPSRRRSSRRTATSPAFRGGSVRSWLSRICVNAAMDAQRAKRRRPVQPYPELDDESWQPPTGPDADPERLVIGHERTRVLGEALARITTDQRTAIVLFDVEGYDYAEIADMTGRLAWYRQVPDPSRPARPARPARGPDGTVPWLRPSDRR